MASQLQVVEIKIVSDSNILKYGSDILSLHFYCYDRDCLVDRIYLDFIVFLYLIVAKINIDNCNN